MPNDIDSNIEALDNRQIAELERIVSSWPPGLVSHDPENCNIEGDPELLMELQAFINTCRGVKASRTAIHEFAANVSPTEVVAICGAASAIAGAMAAYFHATKRKFRIKHEGKEYEFNGYTEAEVSRMLKLFKRIILRRK